MTAVVASLPRRDARVAPGHSHRVDRALVAGLAAAAALLMLAEAGSGVQSDTWLALLGGREIVTHGLPHHALTVYGAGHRWIDQQWLAQLISYGLYRAGGLGLLSLVNALSLFGALAGAVLTVRRLGAGARAVLWVLPLALWCFQVALTVRPQALAYPLFVVVVYLLIRDLAHPRRVVFWCLPVLVLWANLHGSVTLGAALVVLRGLAGLLRDRTRLRTQPRLLARHVTLLVAPVICVLITPYGPAVIAYYRATLLNSGFRSHLAEWSPVTGYPSLAVGFFALAALTVWSFARRPRATSRWEQTCLLLLAAGAILAVRNLSWFALLALIVVPRSLPVRAGTLWGDRLAGTRRRLTFILTGICLSLAVAFGVRLATASEARLTASRFPVDSIGLLRAQAADPQLRVLADTDYSDWLLWHVPAFAHRLAYDISYEMITAAQLTQIVHFQSQVGLNWSAPARGYGLLVLKDKTDHAFRTYFGRQPGARILYDRDGLLVIRRPVPAG